MKHLRGARFFLYHLSYAGLGLILSSLAAGAAAYHHPSLEIVKSGVEPSLPPFLFASVPSLCLAALAGLLAWLAITPCAAFLSDRSRTTTGRRRMYIATAIMPLTLCALLVFLPFQGASSGLSLILVTVYAALIGGGAGLFEAPALALEFSSPAQERDRIPLAAAQGGFLAAGCLIGLAVIPGFWSAFPGLGPDGSFQTAYLILVLGSSVCLAGAFFAAKEKNPALPASPLRNRRSLFPATAVSLRTLARFRPFRRLLPAQGAVFFAFWLSAACLYFAGRDLMLTDGETIRSAAVLFLLITVLAQPAVVLLARRLGARRLYARGLPLFAVLLLLLAFTGVTPYTAGLRWNCATGAAQGADSLIWIGTKRGVSRFDGRGWAQVTRAEGLIDDRITSLRAGDRGVWFGTMAGASFWDGRTWTHFSQASGLVDNRVLSIIPDGDAVWFLTPVGISLLRNAQWYRYTPDIQPHHGAPPALSCFALDRRGALWVGTTAGLFRLDDNGWTPYTVGNGLNDDRVTSLAVSADNTVYIGTYQGVARYSAEGEWSHLTTTDGLPSNAVRTIRIAPDGTVYVATSRGVYMSRGHDRRVLTQRDGLVHDRVNDILFARDRSVWFITENGVSVLSNGRFRSYQNSFPLIWGLAAILLLALPAALLFSLPRLFEAEAADAYREKTGQTQEALSFALPLIVRGVALLAAGLVALVLFAGTSESIENPLPVRMALVAAAVAAGAGVLLFHASSTDKKRKTLHKG